MSASRLSALLTLLLLGVARVGTAHAEGYAWLRSENKHVREGNEKLKAGDAKSALAAYDAAARELPSAGGVHLDRGLALMKAGDANAARTALQLATQPPASPEVRADAYYDLGVSFFRDADAHAGKNEHEDAQKMFREAADAFKQSLRLRSGDHNTAWNYELSARRVVEQQEKQKQKEQQDKDKQKKDDQKQDDQKQDPQSGNDSQDKQDDSKKDPQKDAEDKQKQQDKQAQDKQAQKDKPAPKDGQKPEEPAPQPKPEPLRPDVAQALDSLQDGEQNLERLRAMQRAASERRSPEKDW